MEVVLQGMRGGIENILEIGACVGPVKAGVFGFV